MAGYPFFCGFWYIMYKKPKFQKNEPIIPNFKPKHLKIELRIDKSKLNEFFETIKGSGISRNLIYIH